MQGWAAARLPVRPLRSMTIVIKRDGAEQDLVADKLHRRCSNLSTDLDVDHVDPHEIVKRLLRSLELQALDKISSQQLDDLLAETTCYLGSHHPDYVTLAGRITISNLHKCTKESFSHVVADLYHHANPRNGQPAPLVSKEVFDIVQVQTCPPAPLGGFSGSIFQLLSPSSLTLKRRGLYGVGIEPPRVYAEAHDRACTGTYTAPPPPSFTVLSLVPSHRSWCRPLLPHAEHVISAAAST